MIAMALACRPKLLIADEPTTALDVTIQAQILDLLLSLQQQNGMALVLITHDMGVVAETADRVIVQYAGQQVEANATRELFADPHHPYTAALLAALPERATQRRLPAIPGVVPGQFDRPRGLPVRAALRLRVRGLPPRARRGRAAAELGRALLLHAAVQRRAAGAGGARGRRHEPGARSARAVARLCRLARRCSAARATVQALAGVSFSLAAGRTLAVVGESGSGKSTLARLLTLIETPTAGALMIEGEDVATPTRRGAGACARKSRWCSRIPTARSTRARRSARRWRSRCWSTPTMRAARARGGGARDHGARSGCGPNSTTAIPTCSPAASASASPSRARSMLRPKILVLDEPVSALDVSIRAQVLNLLAELQEEFTLAYVFVSHDLSVVRHIADEVMVIYLGHAVEIGSREAIFSAPQHPYTRALLSATPVADPGRQARAHHPQGRAALADRAAARLSVPSALPARLRALPQEKPPLEAKQGRDVACWAVDAMSERATITSSSARARPAACSPTGSRADPRNRVLLLEAGGRDNWIWLHIPVGYLYAIGNPRADWRFKTASGAGPQRPRDRLSARPRDRRLVPPSTA